MREKGKIKSIENGKAVVELNAGDSCQSCQLKGCCHAVGGTNRVLHVDNPGEKYQPEDWVEIETSPGSFLTAAFMVFLFPLFLAFIAYFIVSSSVDQQKGMLAFWSSFIIAELLVVLFDRTVGRKKRFQPKIISKISGD